MTDASPLTNPENYYYNQPLKELDLHIERYLVTLTGEITEGSILHLKKHLSFLRDELNKLGILKWQDVKKEHLQTFEEMLYYGRLVKRSTLSYYRKGWRRFFRYLKEKRLIREVPIYALGRIKRIERAHRYAPEELLKSFKGELTRSYRSFQYIQEIERSLKFFLTWLKDSSLTLQNLTHEHISKYQEHLKNSYWGKTKTLKLTHTRKKLNYVKTFYQWLHRKSYIGKDPWKTVSMNDLSGPSHSSITPTISINDEWTELNERYERAHIGRFRPKTIHRYGKNLIIFFNFLREKLIESPDKIEKSTLEAFRDQIQQKTTWGINTQVGCFIALKSFMNFLDQTDQIIHNPARKVLWPRKTQGLPTRLMNQTQVKTLLESPLKRLSPCSLRDKALFEVFYSTGLRVSELASLKIQDIDFERGLVRVNEPKGGPDYQRVIPIGKIALEWVGRYIKEVRTQLEARGWRQKQVQSLKFKAQREKPENEDTLFLTKYGTKLTPNTINSRMIEHAQRAGLKQKFSSHSWRVTCATGMIEHGADIRYVQEQLGHRSLKSTQIYTRLSPQGLKKVHEKTHPREREYRKLARG